MTNPFFYVIPSECEESGQGRRKPISLLFDLAQGFQLAKFLSRRIFRFNAAVAQLVEQLIRNQQVSGSNPLGGFFC